MRQRLRVLPCGAAARQALEADPTSHPQPPLISTLQAAVAVPRPPVAWLAGVPASGSPWPEGRRQPFAWLRTRLALIFALSGQGGAASGRFAERGGPLSAPFLGRVRPLVGVRLLLRVLGRWLAGPRLASMPAAASGRRP